MSEEFDSAVRVVPRYDREPVRIRVTMVDGKVAQYELMVDNVKLRDLTRVEIVELIMQAASTLRY